MKDYIVITAPRGSSSIDLMVQYDVYLQSSKVSPILLGSEHNFRSKDENFISEIEKTEYLKVQIKIPENLIVKSPEYINWKSTLFQDWLRKNNLFRFESESELESEFEFARRVYVAIAKQMSYFYPAPRHLDEIIQKKGGDCGALNKVVLSTLIAHFVDICWGSSSK